MSLVGAFPGINDWKRRTIRAPVNPADKATIISIYPREIDEVKHTIQPGRFLVPAGSFDNPAMLVVGPSSWWREIDEDQPLLEIPNGAIQVADSIIKDWCNGLLAYTVGIASPGLFYIPGEIGRKTLVESYKLELAAAYQRQNRWYDELIHMADSLWARSNGNPMAIDDNMRIAAKERGIENKDWLKNFTAMEMVRCLACGSLRNPNFPICQTCKAVVDPERAKALNLQFIQ